MTARVPRLLLLAGVVLVGAASSLLAQPRSRLDFRLPAPIVAQVGLGAAAEAPAALVLVGNEGEERTLLQAEIPLQGPEGTREPRLSVLRTGLSPEVTALEVMEGPGGEAWAIVGAPGRILALGPVIRPDSSRLLVEAPGVDLAGVEMERAPRPLRVRPVLRGGRLDGLELREGEAARPWSVELPVRAELADWGLRLTTPPVSWLATSPPVLVATGPAGDRPGKRDRRRRATVVSDGESTDVRLDVSEIGQILDRRLIAIDGDPCLAFVAIPKLGVFVDRTVEIYRLEAGEPEGRGPTARVRTDCPLWSDVKVVATKVDEDGHDDLVLGCSRGFDGDELRLEVHRGAGAGRLGSREMRRDLRITAVDWSFEHDVTGDGRIDLVVLTSERLVLWEGEPEALLTREPVWSIALDPIESSQSIEIEVGGGNTGADSSRGGSRRLLLTDWNADGLGEIVLFSETGDGTTVMSVFR